MTLDFQYDADKDILTVEGVRYDGNLFRVAGLGPRPGYVFRIVEKSDGVVAVKVYIVDDALFDLWHENHSANLQNAARIKREGA